MQTQWYLTPDGFELVEHSHGVHLYANKDKSDWFVELWGSSTKYPDITYRMSESVFIQNDYITEEQNVPQWLQYIASMQLWPFTARSIGHLADELFDKVFN